MRKENGFTLIELLAVIVLLGIIAAIAIPALIGSYRKSKDVSEDAFKKRLTSVINEYIALNTNEISFNTNPSFKKLKKDTNTDSGACTCIYKNSSEFTLQKLVDKNLVDKNDLINPKNKKRCSLNTVVNIYRDTDMVYCFDTTLDCIDDDAKINNCWFNNSSTCFSCVG